MTHIPTDWTNPESPVVKACLTVPCAMCKARPGDRCVSVVPGKPLLRAVHHYRINKLIKGGQNPGEDE